MAVTGLRGTGDWGVDERPKNFRELILWRNPGGSAVLTALMARMRKQSVNDPEFNWWEEELNPIRLQVNAAFGAGTTALTVDVGDAEDLVVGDILLLEKAGTTTYDNELMQVDGVTSPTAFSVVRGVAGTVAVAIVDDDFLTRVGNAFAEGADAPDASTRNPTKFQNFTQIFKTSYRQTRTAMNTFARTGNAMKNDKRRKMFDHSVTMEHAFMYGRPFEEAVGNEIRRYTGGLSHFLSTAGQIVLFTAPTRNEDGIIDSISDVFDYTTDEGSSSERLVLAGNGFLNQLNKVARDSASTRINFDGTVKTYGMELMRWILPQGTLFVKTHPLMNVHGRFKNDAFVLEPRGIIYRPLQNSDTKPDEGVGGKGIQLPGQDQFKGQWIGEIGIEFHHMRTMKWLREFGTA